MLTEPTCPSCSGPLEACTCTPADRSLSTGAALLAELHRALLAYVAFPSAEAADAVALWVVASHAQQAWEAAPRLVITAPEKQCGKSRLLDVIEATCHAPLVTVNVSPAALVRSIGDDPPTLLLDEADTVFGRKAADANEDLRGILNAGHQRNRAYIRWDANARQAEHCPTFAMAALAGIGDMPDTIMDRAVVVRMRRRAPGETVQPFRSRRDGPPLNDLRERIAGWAAAQLDVLTDAEPDMPVDDRPADNWEPLVAVADVAGSDWPKRARSACLTLTGAAAEDTTIGERLLADLRTVFGEREAMHGATILEALHGIEEAPWADWYGRPFNARDLAKLLRPYGVRSQDVKVADVNRKGYRRDALYDAWRRYLPESALPATAATDATAQVSGTPEVAGSGQQALPATGTPPLTSGVAGVAAVADTPHDSAYAAEFRPCSVTSCSGGTVDPSGLCRTHRKDAA